jgi:asparagine synthase (glutamine-hydrolysing)
LLTGPSHLTKADMARTPRRPLPPSIVRRPKTGFTVPVRDWLMADAGAGAGNGVARPERGLRGWAKMVLTHVRGGA